MPDKLIELIQNNDETIKERVRWAITYVADNHGMSNEKLSKYPGCATSTINSYRRKITMPGLDFFVVFLYKFCRRFCCAETPFQFILFGDNPLSRPPPDR